MTRKIGFEKSAAEKKTSIADRYLDEFRAKTNKKRDPHHVLDCKRPEGGICIKEDFLNLRASCNADNADQNHSTDKGYCEHEEPFEYNCRIFHRLALSRF